MEARNEWLWWAVAVVLVLYVVAPVTVTGEEEKSGGGGAMIYTGAPRDYEFYVGARVMMRSLAKLGVDADRVVIASSDRPECAPPLDPGPVSAVASPLFSPF